MNIRSFVAVLLTLIVCAGIQLRAETFTTLVSFNGSNGAGPVATLTPSGDGSLYGTTSYGGNLDVNGTQGLGTVFKLTTNLLLNTLIVFDGTNGAVPQQSLVLQNDTLYGTTEQSMFSVNADGSDFTNLEYNEYYLAPHGLLLSGNTLFWPNRTYGAGFNFQGGIFSANTDGSDFTFMFGFDGIDGGEPQGSLILSGDTLYGVSDEGGSWDAGTIFAINTNGTSFTNLCSFTGSDGIFPQAGLIISGNTLYGTASAGGNYDAGTIFSVNTDGTDYKTLYNFTGGSDGANTSCSLVLIGNTLYGTAEYGGSFGGNLSSYPSTSYGTLFFVNTDGTGFTVLHTFSVPLQNATNYVSATATNTDGVWPVAGLTLLGNVLYGTTSAGGAYGEGTVFALSLPVPSLGITISGNQVILSWPSSASNFNLLTSPDLVDWNKITNGIAVVGSNYTFTNAINGYTGFFRLQTQ